MLTTLLLALLWSSGWVGEVEVTTPAEPADWVCLCEWTDDGTCCEPVVSEGSCQLAPPSSSTVKLSISTRAKCLGWAVARGDSWAEFGEDRLPPLIADQNADGDVDRFEAWDLLGWVARVAEPTCP